MGRKNLLYVSLAIAAIFFVSGCQTVPKKFKEEVSGIKSKVETMESRLEGVEAKQAEVERATGEQAMALEELKASGREKTTQTNVVIRQGRSSRAKEHIKDIQVCLKNAGFYSGKIDGVKGRNTKKAIKEFQKANGLKADGVVGIRTWELLSKYESGPSAASPGSQSQEEGTTK